MVVDKGYYMLNVTSTLCACICSRAIELHLLRYQNDQLRISERLEFTLNKIQCTYMYFSNGCLYTVCGKTSTMQMWCSYQNMFCTKCAADVCNSLDATQAILTAPIAELNFVNTNFPASPLAI